MASDRSFTFMLAAPTFNIVYLSGTASDMLGLPNAQLLQHKFTDLLEEGEQVQVTEALRNAVRQNKTAVVLYLRILHFEPVGGQPKLDVCRMAISVAGNVIVGCICFAPNTIGNTLCDRSAEEVIVTATEDVDFPGSVGYPAVNWTGTRFPRTVLLLNRFSLGLPITHCTSNAILDNETCVGQKFYDYVAARDEDSVKSFISSMRQGGVSVNNPSNAGFVYHTFNLCVTGRASGAQNGANEVRVSVVGQASSDSFVLVLKREH